MQFRLRLPRAEKLPSALPSTKAAMQYQHPDVEHIRTALNVARAEPNEMRITRYVTFCVTVVKQ